MTIDLELEKIDLYNTAYTFTGRMDETEILKIFQNKIKYILNILENLINGDLKNMSDEEFYNLISKLYNFDFDEYDYLKIISEVNHQNYNLFIKIGTYMTFNDIATEGHGKGFEWWNQLYQITYIAALSDDAEIESDVVLTKEEIKRLIESKKIVLVKTNANPILNELPYSEEVETLPTMDLGFECYSKDSSIELRKQDGLGLVPLLRKKFTKRKIVHDMKAYINELEEDINKLLSMGQDDFIFSRVSKLCSNWYNQSEEKQMIRELVKKVNN